MAFYYAIAAIWAVVFYILWWSLAGREWWELKYRESGLVAPHVIAWRLLWFVPVYTVVGLFVALLFLQGGLEPARRMAREIW